jgi:hypothetical protein
VVLNNAWSKGVYYVKVYGANNQYDNTQCYDLDISTSSTAFSRWSKYDHEVDFIDGTAQEMSIYPNPARERIMIEAPFEAMEKARVTIYDMMGRRITESTVAIEASQPISYDVSNLESGMYLLSVEENGEVYSKKFIVGK